MPSSTRETTPPPSSSKSSAADVIPLPNFPNVRPQSYGDLYSHSFLHVPTQNRISTAKVDTPHYLLLSFPLLDHSHGLYLSLLSEEGREELHPLRLGCLQCLDSATLSTRISILEQADFHVAGGGTGTETTTFSCAQDGEVQPVS